MGADGSRITPEYSGCLGVGAAGKLTVVDASRLVAGIIARTHRGEAVSDLLPYD